MTQPLPPTDAEMPRELDLPSGGHVTFVDPEDLTGDDQRRVIAGVKADMAQGIQLGMAMDFLTGTACMLIESWTIPYKAGAPREPADEPWPLPSTNPAVLGKLKLRDYRAIQDAVEPAVRLLFPRQASPDDAGKPGTPTPPANG